MLEQAVQYFKGEPGFDRLFYKWSKRYRELGRIPQRVSIGPLTDMERDILPVFFGRYYRSAPEGTFTVAMFDKALNQEGSKFSGLTFAQLLTAYNGGCMITNAEKQQEAEERKTSFFDDVFSGWSNPKSEELKQRILQKELGSAVFHKWYEDNRSELGEHLKTVFRAVDHLTRTQDAHYLPLFAAQVTGNPHAFDLNTSLGKVFLSILALMNGERCGKRSNEDLTILLERYGVLRDDLQNNVICSGILAYDPINQKPLLSWQGCYDERIPKITTLRELLRPVEVRVAGHRKSVFAIENSGVFSALLDRFSHEDLPPMICTAGSFRLAALLLIDALVTQCETIIYYSGDMDPEGLLLAQRLLDRHKERIIPWRFSLEDYSRSESNEAIGESRITKLSGVTAPELQGVKVALTNKGLAAYQEKLLDVLEQDIRTILE